MTHRTVIRLFSGALLAALVLGCGDDEPTAPGGPFLVVSPPNSGLDPGQTVQLTATMGGATVPVTWTSSNTAIITVTPAGLVTAVGSGMAAATAALVSDPSVIRSASLEVFTLQGTALTDGTGVPVSSSGARGSTQLYRIFVPTGATNLTVTIAGGTGDVDLYVRRQTPPTLSSFTCASENAANGEVCAFTNPASGTWYILLGLWDPYAGATLTANVTP